MATRNGKQIKDIARENLAKRGLEPNYKKPATPMKSNEAKQISEKNKVHRALRDE